MTTLNLNSITIEIFETIIRNLIDTNCRLEFNNYTEAHEKIALNIGLSIYTGDTLTVFNDPDENNNYY